jgi:hypothetical protein
MAAWKRKHRRLHEVVKLVPKVEPTPSSDVLLKKIIVPQFVKKFQAPYGIGGFITILEKAHP